MSEYIPLKVLRGSCPECKEVTLLRGYCTKCALFWHIGYRKEEEKMSEETYHCSVHGEIDDVMKMAFDSSILRDPTTHAYERIERIYCIACYVAFMDQQLGEVTPMVKYSQQEPSNE
jgi:hypothetical protein